MKATKTTIRKKTISQRLSMSNIEIAKKNKLLINNLLTFINKTNIKNIFLFYPIKNEPNCLLLIDKLSKITTALPVVTKNNNLYFYKWNKNDSLRENKYKIKQPYEESKNLIHADKKTVICVPALAVDKRGYRIGYGGGFYDRYIEKNPNGIYIALIFSDFFYKLLPSNQFDKKINYICTEKDFFTPSLRN